MLATAWSLAAVAPITFAVGALVGFIIGARFRIERRNGKDDHDG